MINREDLRDCITEDEQAPAPKKTVRQVIEEYALILNDVYEARTAGDFTWKGILYGFVSEIASTERE